MPAAYKYIQNRHHPLSPPSGRIPEHRVILYAKLGPGRQKCYWCGRHLTWAKGDGTVTTDHVDGNTRNNDPENLVPSCHGCHVERSRDPRFESTPFIVEQGVRQAVTERVCLTCTKKFLIATKHLRRTTRQQGRYCSKPCMYNRDRSKDVKHK